MNEYNEYAKTHGIKKEFWEEGLQFRYQNKSLREYSASIYGLAFQAFPVTAFTSEAVYLQWCIQVSGMMPLSRGKEFKQYMRDRLAEAVEEEIPPNTEEGIEVGIVVLRMLYNEIKRCRNFDEEQENVQLEPGEWIFLETVEEARGLEVFIKYEGLGAKIMHEVSVGNTETKLARKDVVKWMLAHGRYYNRMASVNRRRSAYVLPIDLVKNFEVFAPRSMSMPSRNLSPEPWAGNGKYTEK